MRHSIPTSNEITKVTLALETFGKAIFKGVAIVKSETVNGFFHDIEKRVFADNVEELLFDLNETQGCIDHDNFIL